MYLAGCKNKFLVWMLIGGVCGQTTAFARGLEIDLVPPPGEPLPSSRSGLEIPYGFAPLRGFSGSQESRGTPLYLARGKNKGAFAAGAARKAQKDEGKPSRSGLYLSAALAASAAAVALWSKHEADQAYDHYLHAAGEIRQKDQFERAERYDRIAGAAFVAMEAGIVLTTYLVFF